MAESRRYAPSAKQLCSLSRTVVPLMLPSAESLNLSCVESTRSFPAFRLKKSYWQKEKRHVRSPRRVLDRSVQVATARLTARREKPSPIAMSHSVGFRQRTAKLYHSLSKVRKVAVESTDSISWRPKPLASTQRTTEEVSNVEACRNMYLSFDSHSGKYNVEFRDTSKQQFSAKLHTYLRQHRQLHATVSPPRQGGKLRLRPERPPKLIQTSTNRLEARFIPADSATNA